MTYANWQTHVQNRCQLSVGRFQAEDSTFRMVGGWAKRGEVRRCLLKQNGTMDARPGVRFGTSYEGTISCLVVVSESGDVLRAGTALPSLNAGRVIFHVVSGMYSRLVP